MTKSTTLGVLRPTKRTSLESASRLIRSCCELLFLLFVVGAVRAPLHGSEAHVGSGNGIPDASLPTIAQINHAIELSAGYLERACGPDGKFVYEIDIHTGTKSNLYNIVRHAGAIYALAMLNHSQPNPQAVDAMVRAAAFLRQNYIGPGVHPDQLVAWSEPRAEQPKSQHDDAELGATGLGLAALAEVRNVNPKAVPLEELQALGRFLLFLQKDDGRFINKYRAESGPVEDWESLYYPGEAALAFVALYEADHSHEWLVAAGKALSFLAKTRHTVDGFSRPLGADGDPLRQFLLQVDPEIIYFFCHALASLQSKGKTYGPALDFGGGFEGVAEDVLEAREFAGKRWARAPLVFINGCSTAGISPYAPSEFITESIKGRKAAVVIGTEVTVWEALATEMAKRFLLTFLDGKTSARRSAFEVAALIACNEQPTWLGVYAIWKFESEAECRLSAENLLLWSAPEGRFSPTSDFFRSLLRVTNIS